MSSPKLIVMLTHNDVTVGNAYDIFLDCIESNASYYGIKENGIDIETMKKLVSCIKNHNKKAVLEIVAYTEPECIDGVKLANECGFDIVMGTRYFLSVSEYCRSNNIKYIPFIGNVHDRPSVLEGSVDEILSETQNIINAGIRSFDLLAYRYTGDSEELARKLTALPDVEIIMAGGIDSFGKLDFIRECNPYAFTIGSAFFDNKFGNGMVQQINAVIDYMEK